MFIKKIKKDDKVYYVLTFLFQEKDKTDFKSCFIPERLADYLVKCGVTLKEKDKK